MHTAVLTIEISIIKLLHVYYPLHYNSTLVNYFYLHIPARRTVSIHTISASSLSTILTALCSSGHVVEATVASPITLSVDPVAVVAGFNKTHKENQGKKRIKPQSSLSSLCTNVTESYNSKLSKRMLLLRWL